MLRIGTVFSGIGAFEYMLKSKNIKHEILFACDCGDRKINITQKELAELSKMPYPQKTIEAEKLYSRCKKENRIKETYLKNYDFSKGQWYSDIRFLDGSLYRNKIDVFVGGSPCQSFSLMGKRRGLEDTRGTLFFEYARLVNEIKPTDETTTQAARIGMMAFNPIAGLNLPLLHNVKKAINPPIPRTEKIMPIIKLTFVVFLAVPPSDCPPPRATLDKSKAINGRTPMF